VALPGKNPLLLCLYTVSSPGMRVRLLPLRASNPPLGGGGSVLASPWRTRPTNHDRALARQRRVARPAWDLDLVLCDLAGTLALAFDSRPASGEALVAVSIAIFSADMSVYRVTNGWLR